MKAILLLLSTVVGFNLHAEIKPKVEIVRIEPAPIDRAKDVRVVLKIINDTPKSFFYSGFLGEPVFLFTETKLKDGWEANGLLIAAAGLSWSELKPGSELVVKITPQPPTIPRNPKDEPSIVYPLRFRFDCLAAPQVSDSDKVTKSYTRVCEATEFVKNE